MSIATAITAAQGRVADAYTAISNKGGTLPATQNLANMPAAINSIPSGGSSEKYGANINTLLGDVDANGVLQPPTEQSDLVFTGVKDVADYALYFKFSRTKVKSASFSNLTTINSNGCSNMFNGCVALTSVSLPNLTTIGNAGCYYMFYNCTSLTSVSFSALTTISGSSGCQQMLSNCTALTSASFPNLKIISGNYGCSSMFNGCRALTDVYFPALTTASFGSYKNQFGNMMTSTGTGVTHTLHFPSNLESTIQGLTGYPNFGGTSGSVVLSFDLPATE